MRKVVVRQNFGAISSSRCFLLGVQRYTHILTLRYASAPNWTCTSYQPRRRCCWSARTTDTVINSFPAGYSLMRIRRDVNGAEWFVWSRRRRSASAFQSCSSKHTHTSFFIMPNGSTVNTCIITAAINPLESRGNYSATSNNTKLVHWPLMGGLLHMVHRRGGWAGPHPSLYQM